MSQVLPENITAIWRQSTKNQLVSSEIEGTGLYVYIFVSKRERGYSEIGYIYGALKDVEYLECHLQGGAIAERNAREATGSNFIQGFFFPHKRI